MSLVLLGKIRNREEKRLRSEKEKIQADYELEKRTIKSGEKKGFIKSVPTQQYTKKFTQKEWDRFSDAKKQILTNRYNVVITDHETRKEKTVRRLKKINLKNFDNAMKRFDKEQKSFWKNFDEGFTKAGAVSAKSYSVMGEKKKSKSRIFGSSNTSVMGENKKHTSTSKIYGSKKVKVF